MAAYKHTAEVFHQVALPDSNRRSICLLAYTTAASQFVEYKRYGIMLLLCVVVFINSTEGIMCIQLCMYLKLNVCLFNSGKATLCFCY